MSDKILTWKEAIKLYPKINSTPLDAFDKVTIEEVLFTLDTGAEFTAPLSLNIDNPENVGLFDIRLIDFRADNFDPEKAKSEITFKELKAGSNILLDESDGLITISSTVDGDQLLNEILNGNTEERISVNYTGGKLNFVVEDNLSAYTNDVGFLSSVSWGDLTGNYSIAQSGGNITGSIDIANGTFSLFSPASFGEPNTASNQGTLGIGIFDNKNVWDLEFRNLNSLSSAITLALDVGNKNINLDLVETNINHDNLSGYVANEHIDWSVDQLGTVIHPNNYVQSSVTQEQVQDFAWSVLTGTQSLITVTYLDGSNQVSFVVEPNLSNYNNDAGFLTSIPASYVQAGENISQLVNDAGYITTDTNDIDYVSNVQLVGSNLTFTGIGNAFNSTVDLSSLSVAETDPVFSASPAAGITAPDITNWNNAFSWGDHSLAGYLTAIPITYLQSGDNVSELINDAGYLTSFSETDPVFTASQAFNITAGDITNLSNLSGVNTGDQTTIVGITGTKAQFNTAVTDGDFLFVGDITDTNDIDYINGSTFVGGLLTLTGVGNAGTSISLDGRYLQSEVNDLSSSVTWVNVPDANITESSVTQHEAALSITWGQISGAPSIPSTATEIAVTPFSHIQSTNVQTALEEIVGNQIIENGFADRVSSILTIDDSTRTVTCAVNTPTYTSYDFWVDSEKYTKTTDQSVVFPDLEGAHYIYFDETGTLVTTQTFSEDIITRFAFVCFVYWNATDNVHILFGDERHGREMDSATHVLLHRTSGTQYDTGLALTGITTDGSGDLDSHAQFAVQDGIIRDEDIAILIEDGNPQELSPIAQIPTYYRLGVNGDWRKIAATNFPITTTGTGRAAWNEFTGATWQLTEVTNNDFVLMHIYATNDVDTPIIAIIGENEYSTLGAARTGAETEINNLVLGDLDELLPEYKPIASVIYQTSNGYANTVKSRISSTDEGDTYIDWRFSKFTSTGGVNLSDHGNLTGLSDDDHPQYHNDARALTWLGTRTSDDLPEGATNLYFPGFSSLAADYGFTDNSSNWNTAYDNHIVGINVTGTTTKTITLTQQDGGTIQANFTDLSGAGADGNDFLNNGSFNTINGELTLNVANQADVVIDLDGRYLQSEVNDLTASVTWANVPDINITQSSVTQHQGALSITESQISDLGNYLEAADINTLAELNAILTDATLIDTTDSRLSDARNPLAHTHVVADITDFPTLPVISDVAYNSTTWNNNLDGASKNAIRDKIDAMDTTIAANTAKVSFPGFTSLLADYGFVDNSTNWNNAFSWGDHALEGYLTSADLSGYVQTTNIDTLAELNAIVTDATLASQAWVTGQGYLTSFTEVNDLSAAVVWANIPDANVPETAVTQHQAALTITESQISDLGNYSVVGHTHNLSNITDITATAAEVNLLDLSLLTAGWVLRATTANTAAWGQLNTSDLNNDSGFISSTAGNWTGTFDGQEGTYYLDYNNFTNTPTIPSTLSNLTDVVSATNTNRFVLVANGTTGYVGRALLEADISDLGNYALAGHTHVASDITDFDTEVSNNASVVVNTAKVSFVDAPSDGNEYVRFNGAWSIASGGSSNALTIDVNQTSHGLSVGDVIKSNGTANQYTTAQANSDANSEVVGIVTTVTDVNNFTFTFSGLINNPSVVPAGTAGDALYLSDTVAGGLTTTQPADVGEVQKPLGIIIQSGQKMILFNMRGSIIEQTPSVVTYEKSITIESPTSSEDITMWYTNKAITITQLSAVVLGTSPGVTYTIRHDANRNDTGTEVVTSGTTALSTTTGTITTVFNDATIPADSWIWIETTSTSGTVTQFSLTIEYTID